MLNIHPMWMHYSGGSKIFQRRGRQSPRWEPNLLFGQKFPKNCMKMKEFGPRGGGVRPWRPTPLRSANALWAECIFNAENLGNNILLLSISSFTLRKVQKIRVISRGSENTFSLLQWLSMRKQILKLKKNKEDICPKNNIAQLYFI